MADMDMVRRFAGEKADKDGVVLENCYRSAVAWYEKSGVPETDSDDYRFWVANLAAWFYDNRGGNASIPPYIVTSVHQLRPVKKGAAE